MSRSEALSDEALLTALDGLVERAASGMLDEALLRRVVIATVGIFARSCEQAGYEQNPVGGEVNTTEITDLGLLEGTFRAINAETQLLYSSDWPHWDFDTPGRIAGIPFLSEQGTRNILGETANRIFNLEPERTPDLKGFRSLAARAEKGDRA